MSSQKARIVFISAVYPLPEDCGKKVVVGGLIRYLVQRFGGENLLYLYLGAESHPNSKAELGLETASIPLSGSRERMGNVLRYSLLTHRKSIQESVLYSETLKAAVHEKLEALDPSLIIFDTVRCAQLGVPAGYSGKTITYLEDLFSVRYQRMLASLDSMDSRFTDVLGGFAKHVPVFLRPIVQNFSFIQRYALSLERRLVAASEDTCVSKVNISLLLNDDEVSVICARAPNADVRAIRPWLKRRIAVESCPRNYRGGREFVFLGLLSLAHNELALLRFLEEAFPRCLELMPDIRLRIIGRNPSKRLAAAVKGFENNISLEGYIEDIEAVLAGCSGMIIPLVIGSGVKIKTLEALSRGVPCISTRIGVESVPVESGRNCYVEDRLSYFPEIMLRLCEVGHNEEISNAAFDFFMKNYSEKPVLSQYDEIFLPLI